jgi:2,3-bisphosphoglycerate-dependent phosphoglycerate mutase
VVLLVTKMALLILLRHGESQWNLENRFTGWIDVPLSERGVKEAERAGVKLRAYPIDIAYTSVLLRATDTLALALKTANKNGVPVTKDQALNERHYGELQGLDKEETAKKFGKEQVHIWRRSYDVAPPGGESLKDTAARTLPYFDKVIWPDLKKGKNVLIAAHGNSLRSIVMEIEKLTPEEILKVEIPTGVPIVYEFDSTLKLLSKKVLST